MAKERSKFVDGVERNGYDRKFGTEMFDMIEPFADYSFPKAHAFGYGFIAYQTAWLKANYPGAVPRRAAHEREDEPRQGRASTSTSAACSTSRCSSPTSTTSESDFCA